MKLRNLFQLAFLATVIAFTAPSCVKEGPTGADGTKSCLECHSTTAEISMDKKKAEFYLSEHSLGAIAVDYAGGRDGCSQCHSHEGFLQYAKLGIANSAVNKPSAWECSTCHQIHETFTVDDYALRLEAPVKAIADAAYSFDFKNNSNLCVNCHQARTAEPNIAKPGATFAVSVRIGPHHGPQGNVVAGVGFAEIGTTVAYPVAGSSKHFTPSCTGCHMGESTNKIQGGHSLVPSLEACNTCHTATDVDYNHGGLQTDIKADMTTLRDKLVAMGLVVKSVDAVTGLDVYAPKQQTVPMLQAQVLFNYFGLVDDRSFGVHNPAYVTALLTNSIAALN